MTSHAVTSEMGKGSARAFSKALLKDLQALEKMLENGLIESGVRRFGCEQEMFLVNRAWRPAPVAMEVLERLDGEAFTTELARFNLEMNVEPMMLGGACLSALQKSIEELLDMAREAASEEGADVVLTGILPTLGKSDLTLDNISPMPRYYALNESLTRMRGRAYRLQIQGRDELQIEHDSVMLEACNCGCQVHLQVDSTEFAPMYNAAQAMTGAGRLHSPFQHAVFRMDLAGEPWRGFDWHQDYPYNMLCDRSVTAWTPLTPSGAANGGVDVVEAREARLYPVDVRLKRDAAGRALATRDAFIARDFHAHFEAQSRKPELQPGDVLMFHNTVPHRSGYNPGPRHRYSIQVRFGDLLAPEVIARGWRNRRADGFEAFAALRPDLIASEERP